MDALTSEIIAQAKRVATAEEKSQLDLGSVILGLVILREKSSVSRLAASFFNASEVRWPAALIERAEKASQASVAPDANRKFVMSPEFKSVFNALVIRKPSYSAQDFVHAFLESNSPEVTQLKNYMELTGSDKPRRGVLHKLKVKEDRKQKIEEFLNSRVIGQQDAVRMLAEGYIRSEWASAENKRGLRGIFTFMGPPGVGKTMLAEKFAEALNEVEKTKYETLKLSMEMGDDESVLFKLFGVDSAYRSAKTGLIYNTIKGNPEKNIPGNPHQILVFDEIEKAALPTIQSLLTLLNDGQFHDNCNHELVDLSKCFVIFTTNLGQELFASRNRSGILRGSGFSSDDLFDMLGAAKKREHAKHEMAPSALAPEFVSRLRKGGAVLFNQLSGADYAELLRVALPNEFSDRYQFIDGIKMDHESTRLLTLSFLPDISPRVVASEVGRLAGYFVSELAKFPASPFLESDTNPPEAVKITIKCGLSETELQSLRSEEKLRIMVLDDDARMSEFIRQGDWGHPQPEVDRLEDCERALDRILRRPPDILLMDLDLPDSKFSDGGVLALHRRIAKSAPDLPVAFFSESANWESRLPTIISQGGAKAFFSFRRDVSHGQVDSQSAENLLSEDQKGRFQQLIEEEIFEETMEWLLRSRRKLDLEWKFDLKPDGDKLELVASICKTGKRQVVSMADEASGIRPAEIPSVTFDDVFGLERAKERLRDAVGFLKNPGRLSAFGVRPPTGFLLAGPSGTGKTHIARAMANEAGCVFYSLSAGELESKWIGEGEERIRQLFQAARKYAPALIFIDEIDAIASARSPSAGGSNQSVKMLNQLLVSMDGFAESRGQILVLAATNRPEALDPAVLRPGRFDETIMIQAPDTKAREHMFRKRLEALPREAGVLESVPSLVCRSSGMSSAELDRIIREAVYLAARANRESLSLGDLEAACNLVRYGADRRDIVVKEQDRRMTAWHEAGHAVARLVLFPDSKLDFLSIVPNERGALGFAAWQHDETDHSHSAEDYRKHIMVSLAGREAEKLCPDAGAEATNTGVSSDYHSATARAWDAVSRYGFDEDFGCFSASAIPQHLQVPLAAEIKNRVDALLAECLKETRQLMEEKKSTLEKIAEALLKQDALTGEEVQRILCQA
jgi:ATP-dependent metalloprotease FtsH